MAVGGQHLDWVPFLEHMLDLFAKHGLFDLTSIAKAIWRSTIIIRSKTSRSRWARRWCRRLVIRPDQSLWRSVVPMDEALCRSVIDLSGRFYLVYEVQTRRQKIGNFSVELAEHFWRSFAETAKFNLHIDCLRGRNTHHILEGHSKRRRAH